MTDQTPNQWLHERIQDARRPGAATERRTALAQRLGLAPEPDDDQPPNEAAA